MVCQERCPSECGGPYHGTCTVVETNCFSVSFLAHKDTLSDTLTRIIKDNVEIAVQNAIAAAMTVQIAPLKQQLNDMTACMHVLCTKTNTTTEEIESLTAARQQQQQHQQQQQNTTNINYSGSAQGGASTP